MAPEDFAPSYLPPGTRIGAYVVRDQLGHGGGSVAYLVESPGGRTAVLKMSLYPREGTPEDAAMHERFLRQVDALCQLRGVPGVAEILGQDYYPDPRHGFPYFVQEWVPGKRTLLEWASTPQPLKKVILSWTLLAATCGEMGRKHVCHRNLMPRTILVTPQGAPRIVDFGSAIGLGALPLTPTGAENVPGQYDTYSPERCLAILRERATGKPERYEYRPTDDLYALGAIFYQVLTGEHPFDVPDDSDESLQLIAHATPILPSKRNAGVPWGLEKVTARLLLKNPAQRYQSGYEVAEELDAFLKNVREDWNRPFQMPTPEPVPVDAKENEGPMPDTPNSKTPHVDSGAPAEAKSPREAAQSAQPAVLPDEADTAPPRGLRADAALDSDSDGDFDIPRVLDGGPAGSYTVERCLGRGGMGEVYLARQSGAKGFSQLVAIKRLRPGGRDWEARSFADEARILSLLHHENIARVYSFFELGGAPYLVMEYVEGHSLYTLMEAARPKGHRFSESVACAVMAEVAEALDYAHHATDEGRPLRIVHRDVSTTNILISKTGRVVLLDFGVAFFERDGRAVTKTGSTFIKGKAPYLSPEQVKRLPLDGRSDLFSVGTILVELLTGQAPFGWTQDFLTLRKIETVTPEYVASLLLHVSEPLRAVCQRLLAAAPEQRFATSGEAAMALRKCAGLGAGREVIRAEVERLQAKAAPPPGAEAAARALSGVKRARRVVALASALTLAAALVLFFWYVPRQAVPVPSSAPAQGSAVSLRLPEKDVAPVLPAVPAPNGQTNPRKDDSTVAAAPVHRRRVVVAPPSGTHSAPPVVPADGKAVSTVAAPPVRKGIDGAVSVSHDSDSDNFDESRALPRDKFVAPQDPIAAMMEDYVRVSGEVLSPRHNLAALFATDNAHLAHFRMVSARRLTANGVSASVEIWAPIEADDSDTVAVVVNLTNPNDAPPWEPTEGRIVSVAHSSPGLVAIRAMPRVISPGQRGRVALVFNGSAIEEKAMVEILRDSRPEFAMEVTSQDFEPRKSRWPF